MKKSRKKKTVEKKTIVVRNDLKYANTVWTRMTKRERVRFWITTSIIIVFFASIIGGFALLDLTGQPWLLIVGLVGFLDAPLLLLIERINRVFAEKEIASSKKAVEGIADITSVYIAWLQ